MVSLRRCAAVAAVASMPAAAQFPPKPQGVTVVPIQDGYGSTISYKQTSICETTAGVKGFAGYIHLPAKLTGESFDINTFYWYFQARKNPHNAPTSIYLAGGPGDSSTFDAGLEGGPCRINSDSNSTTLNPWSWNNEANLLYIDQPVQTGFSYDVLVNGTLNQLTGTYTPQDFKGKVPKQNATFLVGTIPSQSTQNVTAGSGRGANALWHFMQLWTDHFPEYKANSNKKISLWTISWGGFYGLQTFQFFQMRNDAIKSKTETSGHILNLDTLGIMNGCMDPGIEAIHYPEIATNNTYGYHYYNNAIKEQVIFNVTKPEGCVDLVNECRLLASTADPTYQGNDPAVNTACGLAFADCFLYVQGAYAYSGHSAFDMSQQALSPKPPNYPAGYFNQHWVQQALGVPVNFTPSAAAPEQVYALNTGDAIRTNVTMLDYLLSRGIRISLVFGDRDYRCNWLGGEAVSLATNWSDATAFKKAGYAHLNTNSSYQGGYVRQSGLLSFARVFQAGHDAAYWQPETLYQVFQRSLSGLDVATGHVPVTAGGKYQTQGPSTVRAINEQLPPLGPLDCNLYAVGNTCSDNQVAALQNGTAVLRAFEVIKPAS